MQVYYLLILWKGLHQHEGEIKNCLEIVFWWNDFFDYTWLYMFTFHPFSVLCQKEGIAVEISKFS